MTPRWGKVARRQHHHDWDEKKSRGKFPFKTGLSYAEWPATPTTPSGSSERVKINLIDLPGYSTFITETKASLIAADAALITVDAHVGRRSLLKKFGTIARNTISPARFVLTWMDRELSSFERSMESLEQVFGRNVVALQLPIGRGTGIPRGDRSGGHEGPYLQARWRRASPRLKKFPPLLPMTPGSARKARRDDRRGRRRNDESFSAKAPFRSTT